jgi:hypothetical protein
LNATLADGAGEGVGATEAGGGALEAAADGSASSFGASVLGSSHANPSVQSIRQVHVVRLFIGPRA